jgi:hypothetical protein
MAKTTVDYLEDAGEYKIYRRPVQRRGILQLAPGQGDDGYGDKISTDYIVLFNGKKYRVYAICHSNVASHYILVDKQRLFVRTSWTHSEIPDEPK